MIQEQKLHDKIAAGLGDSRVSPLILAMQMIKENKYTNEALLVYMINYVVFMAETKLVPLHLVEVHNICKMLKNSLDELGLTGIPNVGETISNEYLAV